MVLSAYFDESGTHNDSKTVTVAGYLSTQSLWSAFDPEWRRILSCFGLTKFHMTDFVAKKDDFREGWEDEAKRRALLGPLLSTINKHVIGSVGVSMLRTDYDAAFDSKAAVRSGGPYGLGATWVLLQLARIMGFTQMQGAIKYVFEDAPRRKAAVQKAYDRVKVNPGLLKALRVESLSFGLKAHYVPLQAADVLAYEVRR
ncbi:MAG: DUF3800 domain-containing protein [Dehalococcoidia bacterium]|nr:DUF3800 domain-containing protein [Dehalococcoidia bacterium]